MTGLKTLGRRMIFKVQNEVESYQKKEKQSNKMHKIAQDIIRRFIMYL